MLNELLVVMLFLIGFFAGVGWGQWHAERTMRNERAATEQGKLTVIMPMRQEDAAATMGLLKNLIEQVEIDKTASWANPVTKIDAH